jgi:hypothetical protein
VAEVALSKIEPGEVLGQDVTFPDGRLLLRKGTVLSERHLQFLKNQGIKTVSVGDASRPCEPQTVGREEYEERLEVLDRMFAAVESEPHMMSIKEAAGRQLHRSRSWEKR